MSSRLRAVAAFSIVTAMLLGSSWMLSACNLLGGKGGGTETESLLEVTGRAVNPDNSPVIGAHVILRNTDFLADPISPIDGEKQGRETITDSRGRYSFLSLPAGSYRVELAGTESGGLVRDFVLPTTGTRLELPLDTLKPRGGIMGVFASDSDAQSSRFIQVYGMERLVKADPSGTFIIGNLPAGTYAIRCSSLQPFRREAVLEGLIVKSGSTTRIPTVVLAKEAKLIFHADSTQLTIEGMESGNPFILDNELWSNGIEAEYAWTKASLGTLNLRGNIVTKDMSGDLNTSIDQEMLRGRKDMHKARMAGLANLVDLVPGAAAPLALPPSGRIEDIVPVASVGSDLIVAEARKATFDKPLIVVVGGPLTTVAQAYLTDPSIAEKMVVAGVYSYTLSSFDTVANYLVAKKCRFVQWGRTSSFGGATDTLRLSSLPTTRMGENISAFLYANRGVLAYGDLAPIAYLFDHRLWKSANLVKVSPKLLVQPASDITFDFLDVPGNNNDFALYQDEVLSTLSDSNAYKPNVLPGILAAEAYLGNYGITHFDLDTAMGSTGVTYSAGAWTDYKVSVGFGTKYVFSFHYKGAGGTLSIGYAGQASLKEITLPPSVDWTDSFKEAVILDGGIAVLRLSCTAGSFNVESLDIH